jgi:hypothetical protein
MLKFLVPVRHQSGVSDWSEIARNLKMTLASIAGQTHSDWRCLVVANEGADLPTMPAGCEVLRIDAPYKPLPPRAPEREAYEAAIRADKGMRLWAGLNHMEPGGFVMVTDYDDFVHRDLARLVAENPDNPSGWYIEEGYLYTEGSGVMRRRSEFHTVCGTSNIVRDELLRRAPAGESLDFHIKRRLGSHVSIVADAAKWGMEMQPVPFPAAIYRAGYGQQVSGYRGVWKSILANLNPLHPQKMFETIASVTPITSTIRRNFWGTAAR